MHRLMILCFYSHGLLFFFTVVDRTPFQGCLHQSTVHICRHSCRWIPATRNETHMSNRLSHHFSRANTRPLWAPLVFLSLHLPSARDSLFLFAWFVFLLSCLSDIPSFLRWNCGYQQSHVHISIHGFGMQQSCLHSIYFTKFSGQQHWRNQASQLKMPPVLKD